MAIILIDTMDCYRRADRISEMGQQCQNYAADLKSLPGAEALTDALETFGGELTLLGADIRRETDAWSDYYATNHPRGQEVE